MENAKRARGFTLVELSIVMGLVAILTAMIVSFTSLTSLRVRQATAAVDCMDAFAEYRQTVTDGFALIDTKEGEFAVSTDGALLKINDKDFPPSEHIDRVTAQTNETLLRITLENDLLSIRESFVIASHCGATFTVTGGGS